MSYKALYRSYRPNTFSDVVGQDNIVTTLNNIIQNDRVGHAYLFAGPRGTGKTSVAHIFARALNCTEVLGHEIPCNKCEQCQTKNSMDIIEMDAASNNGVAEIRLLIENSKYAPNNSKYKIYIIDEVHMLTKGAWNALLKTLEEPPKHVIFILATTEAHKIPVTILSRTQRFNFRRIDKNVIAQKLMKVLKNESIGFDEDSISLISKLANGGMRDALSIADQAAAFSGGNITFNSISQVFGIISVSNQIKLINMAYKNNVHGMLTLLTSFVDNGIDIERFNMSLVEIIKDFIVFRRTNDLALLSTATEDESLAINISVHYAYDALDILVDSYSKLKFTESPQQVIEIALLKMAQISHRKVSKNIGDDILIENNGRTQPQVIDGIQVPIVEPKEVQKIKEEIAATVTFSVDEINSIQEDPAALLKEVEAEIEKTGEFKIPEDVLVSDEVDSILEEEVLTTTEFNINDVVLPKKETDFMDLFKFPQGDENPNIVPETTKYDVEEIINLLVQGSKEKIQHLKEQWNLISGLTSDNVFKTPAFLLKDSKIITAGENFVLVINENNNVVEDINKNKNDKSMMLLLDKVIGTPHNIFAITKDEFELVKTTYNELRTSNSLPSPMAILAPVLVQEQEQQSETEKYGSDLFGDLFK